MPARATMLGVVVVRIAGSPRARVMPNRPGGQSSEDVTPRVAIRCWEARPPEFLTNSLIETLLAFATVSTSGRATASLAYDVVELQESADPALPWVASSDAPLYTSK